MKTADIRKTFLDFFSEKNHQIVPSSSLIPHNDPTLLFTNAGMNQFKDVFLGLDQRNYQRAVSSQRCMRAGGKHNDLENVGYTARHHTFFEMLGNFSFGDYFKEEAITSAWELLIDVFKLPKDKLWVTVYHDDHESYDIWTKKIGIPTERCIRIGDKNNERYQSDNFWMMGDTGPCGPCSEIFYDHGSSVPGGPPGSPEEDGDRYMEIWNNVFMQFDRQADGSLTPLPKPSVDTGMGLERMAAVLQGVHSNYDIDIFKHLISAIAQTLGIQNTQSSSLRVIADHIRACTFLIFDGIVPNNEGRGYVLRRIIRRAIRHGWREGARKPFLSKLVEHVISKMKETAPLLVGKESSITQIIYDEESRFFETIEKGMQLIEQELDILSNTKQKQLPGKVAFRLHDTFGFPLDLTADVCRENGLEIDVAGFNQAMKEQVERARRSGAQNFKLDAVLKYDGAQTKFSGYISLSNQDCKIVALYRESKMVDSLQKGETGIVVLDKTPFYAESGGQVGDTGSLRNDPDVFFEVHYTQKLKAHVHGHQGYLKKGKLTIGQTLFAEVDQTRRTAITKNHSATHLLHLALREALGEHVQQRGSLVDPDKTRFDFSHMKPLSSKEIKAIEAKVNAQIQKSTPTTSLLMPLEEAKNSGAMMLFGEKYGEQVRVVDIADSKELCGGTHVANVGEIGWFKIIDESGIASGVRRIEAYTGNHAFQYVQTQLDYLDSMSQFFKLTNEKLPEFTQQLSLNLKRTDKALLKLKEKLLLSEQPNWLKQIQNIEGIQLLATHIDAPFPQILRTALDQLRSQASLSTHSVIVLASINENGHAMFIGSVSKDLSPTVNAASLIGYLSAQVGGKGGGKAEVAQGGGENADKINPALASIPAWLKQTLSL